MKNLLYLTLLLLPLNVICQIQFNDFEEQRDLEVQIGGNASDSLWQIGTPQKSIFDSASSIPNALVTDTINTYPTNSSASFILELNEQTIYEFPYIQLEWFQKTDLEEGIDGGTIEASYDSGSTWSNVFNDTIYRPDVVGSFTWDTLFNGQAGITGVNDWSWMALCWGTYTGIEPDIDSTILIRYTLYSDSIDTNQEGWMLDDFFVRGQVVGNTTNSSNLKTISVYPNPSSNSFFINQSFPADEETFLTIYNSTGTRVLSKKVNLSGLDNFEIKLADFSSGLYYLYLITEEDIYYQKLIKAN